MTQALNKVDSNSTGLAIIEESEIGVYPEPNFESSISSGVTNADVTAVTASHNSNNNQLTFTFTGVDTNSNYHVRLKRTRSGATTPDTFNMGTIVDASSDQASEWTVLGASGNSFRVFNESGTASGDTIFTVIIDVTDEIVESDVFKFEIDNDDNFVSPAHRSVTIAAASSPIIHPLEPNSYGTFGGEITTTVRNPINSSRQQQKGVTTDLAATAEFNQDMTQTLSNNLLQGVLFADAREQPSSDRLAGTSVTIQDFAANNNINLGTGEAADFLVGNIVTISDFTLNSDSVRVITSKPDTDTLTVDGSAFVVETASSFSDAARIEVCGFRQTAGACNLTISGNKIVLTNSTDDYTTLNLNVGQWIFIGGDGANTSFTDNKGYARVRQITANTLVLDLPSWSTPVAETGGGDTIELYYGKYIRNEKEQALIKCRSYQLERTLGDTGDGIESEYIVGAIANEFTLNMPSVEKMNVDFGFLATTNEARTGLQVVKQGYRRNYPVQQAYNTVNDIFLIQLYIHDDTATNPSSLFAYIQESSITINNNAESLKALGELGGFDVNVGTFEVSGEMTAYFQDVAAINAVKNNADVGVFKIAAKANQGFVFDIPLLSVGGGQLTIEQDQPVLIPIEQQGAENEDGYTISYSYFSYLPDMAMPTV